MHITVFAMGSRGDVQPYVALAVGLRRAGYQVRMATHEEFRSLVDGRDIEFAPIGGDPRELMAGERGQDMLASGGNTLRFIWHFAKMLQPLAHKLALNSIKAAQGTDGIVLSNLSVIGGFHQIADALHVPYCSGLLQPFTPTRAFPSAFFPVLPKWTPLRGQYNHASHRIFLAIFQRFFGGVAPMLRKELGLTDSSEFISPDAPKLYGFSPAVIPHPSDWPPNEHVTGYWFLDDPEDWRPPADLEAFLAAGPPPVYVGFGSMRSRDPRATSMLVTEALRRAGQRGILTTGWDGLADEDLPETIFPIRATSHNWLMPRTAAVVHHGGAGTTAAGLLAGVPSILIPFFADQPFWGRTVYALGVGPKPIPQRKLTAQRLAHAITRAVTDTEMRARAAALGERMRPENGVRRAVEIITEHFHR